jgi:hypothetical protein
MTSKPSSAPARIQAAPPRRIALAFLLLAAIAAYTGAAASAQTLARPGLVGSGLNTDPWWQHAVFYEVAAPPVDATHPKAPATDYKAITARLQTLRSLGVDALLLPAPQLPPLPAGAPASQLPPSPVLNDLDDLIHQASRFNMRVLLTLPASSNTPNLSALARFWLDHGVAGLHVVTPEGTPRENTQAIVQSLRKLTAGIVGQRIVISDYDPGPTIVVGGSDSANPAIRRPGVRRIDPNTAQLQIDSRLSLFITLEAGNMRPMLGQIVSQPNLLLDFHPVVSAEMPEPNPELSRAIAVLLLTTHSASLIDAAQNLFLPTDASLEPDPSLSATAAHPVTAVVTAPAPPSASEAAAADLTEWYRALITLHHSNAALRTGDTTMLNFDFQNALVWVARSATNSTLTPPVVVACNLSSRPVRLDVGSAIMNVGLHGTFLHTLLRSDKGMGPQDINGVTLPPYAVYIGELRR